MLRCWTGVITFLAVLAFSAQASEALVLFTGSGSGLSASASFSIATVSGQRQLTILLTNTDAVSGSSRPDEIDEVLTGIFFNLGTGTGSLQNPTLTPVSATLHTGASIVQSSECDVNCSSTSNVGGEFSYAKGGLSSITGDNQGISSAGYLNANNSSGNFGGNNYDGGNPLGGVEFGIVPDGSASWSSGELNHVPLIEGTVKFVLNIPTGLDEDDIKNVFFTYGAPSKENKLTGFKQTTTSGGTHGSVPEPAALTMLGLAMAGLGYRLRRRQS
jgi:hypothetical protein